jgi:hypothetical protein
MLNWLFDIMFKERVEELVEQKFKEKVIEKYFVSQQTELRQRIARVRETLHTQAHWVEKDQSTQVLSSSDLRRSDSKSKVPSKTNQANLDKAAEMDAIKAKLTGKKK